MTDARGRFADVLEALARPDERRFALAELNDLLVGFTSHELALALADAPPASLGPELLNRVAAMVAP